MRKLIDHQKIMKLRADGKTAKEISTQLGCSEQSVYLHLSQDRKATHSVKTKLPIVLGTKKKFPRLSPNGQTAQDHLVLLRQELLSKRNSIDLQLKLANELEKLLGMVGD